MKYIGYKGDISYHQARKQSIILLFKLDILPSQKDHPEKN